MSSADCLRGRLGESEVAHLSLAHQIGHGADGVFDRHRAIHAMLVVEVDVVDAEPLQRRVAGGLHVLRTPVLADEPPVRRPHIAELGGYNDPAAPALDCLPDQDLVRERAIDVGSVEEVDAEVEGTMERRD